jgi:hypothetical protein
MYNIYSSYSHPPTSLEAELTRRLSRSISLSISILTPVLFLLWLGISRRSIRRYESTNACSLKAFRFSLNMKLFYGTLVGILSLLSDTVHGAILSVDGIPAAMFYAEKARSAVDYPMTWQGLYGDLGNEIAIASSSQSMLFGGNVNVPPNSPVGSYTYNGPVPNSNPTIQSFTFNCTSPASNHQPIEIWYGNADGSMFSYRAADRFSLVYGLLPDNPSTQGCYFRPINCFMRIDSLFCGSGYLVV